jgi:hypothetical protein
MDIQISFLLEIWHGRACELAILALDFCIISLLSILSRYVRACICLTLVDGDTMSSPSEETGYA